MMKTILVADDSRTIRQLVRLTFHASGFRVVGAESGAEALERLGSERPALVLADVVLPDADGLALCAEIKARAPGVPVLMLASAARPLDPARADAVAADGEVSKPFETQRLIDEVEAALARGARALVVAPPPELEPPAPPPSPWALVDDGFGAGEPIETSIEIVEDDAGPSDDELMREAGLSSEGVGAAGYGPALEPPRAPSAEQEAHRRALDVWALSDDASAPTAPGASELAAPVVYEAEPIAAPAFAAPVFAAPVVEAPREHARFADLVVPEPTPLPAAAPRPVTAPAQVAGVAAAVEAGGVASAAVARAPDLAALPEAQLVALAREVIEQVAWEVVPELAETIIREELRRLLAPR
jgi:CheY-like chemotaxis protein